jgi:hypothetical protein
MLLHRLRNVHRPWDPHRSLPLISRVLFARRLATPRTNHAARHFVPRGRQRANNFFKFRADAG